MSGAKIAMPQSHSFQGGALSFMSCTSGRESSPLDETDSHQTNEFKTETKKKRFHPLRNLRRMFRRKTRRSSISADSYQPGVPDNPEITPTNLEQRSCSTSRLQEENLSPLAQGSTEDLKFPFQTQNLIRNSRLKPGLSLSHDSIFTPDRADSGLSSSDLENSSLSITVLTPPSKECPMKSQSSCSETSLLSIGSSEVELSPVRSGKTSDLDLGVTTYKLSHSAAKHKMAVKPRRNHGAPRSRRRTMTSKSPLPTTPEVSEEGTTGRSSPPADASPKCDKRHQEVKISWSEIVESNLKDAEEKSEKPEEETEAKEDDGANPKSESFFGRFLSRRSDKKKKLLPELSPEEGGEEKSHFSKKLSKLPEGKGGAGKSPSRRQRMDPVEIPSHKTESDSSDRKDGSSGRKISSSVSPPKSYWPSQTTSRSISPPKVVWPDTYTNYVKPTTGWDKLKTDVSPVREPTENLRNPNFVSELTDSVSLFARKESGKRKKDEEEEETVLKMRRQHSEEVAPRKTSVECVSVLRKKSNSSESMDSVKSLEEKQNPCADVAATQKEHSCVSIKTLNSFPMSYDAIHDGYENIKIIEMVKQEVRNSVEAKPQDSDKKSGSTLEMEKIGKPETEPPKKEQETEVESEVVRRVKPVVSEKPKDLKRTPEFARVNLSRVEQKTQGEGEGKPEKVVPKARTTLVERRKSELLLLTEAEEKDWKAKMKPLKKQPSFSDTEKGNSDPVLKSPAPLEKTESPAVEEKETVEVVLRKKSVASASDEQPELMKVFARRSLKVRESEKIAEEMQRSRDSDKENEIVDSPKEDRKKVSSFEADDKKEPDKLSGVSKGKTNEVKVSIAPLKPEVASRKNVFIPRYGRSLSENNAKAKEDTSILEENKLNKIRNITETAIPTKREETEEEEEETGFKRIQQRKAEWERRAQQGAK